MNILSSLIGIYCLFIRSIYLMEVEPNNKKFFGINLWEFFINQTNISYMLNEEETQIYPIPSLKED